MSDTLGLYLHIPFCRSKCDYCDFYSLAGHESRMDDYQGALLRNIAQCGERAAGMAVDTVYIGGGTPSWYGAERVAKLLEGVRTHFALTGDCEITMEANPDSVSLEGLKLLKQAGVNRISMGMQSADDHELACIHRPHTFGQVRSAVEAARQAGIENLNLDLIYGLPGQSEESWHKSVELALGLDPEHLSCYGLTVEENTPLGRRVAAGEVLPDDDMQAALYLWTVERLAKGGYGQYEISNFAKEGCLSRHNMRYWLGKPYMGLGAGAHSDFGGRRYSYVSDVEQFIKGENLLDEDRAVSDLERAEEYLMLRMRTVRGIEAEECSAICGLDFSPIARQMAYYEREGWAACTHGRWHFTPEGFLLSNSLIVELLEFLD